MSRQVTIDSAYDPPPVMANVNAFFGRIQTEKRYSRQLMIVTLMSIALIAFEIFNFDTTRFALSSLLGDVTFIGLGWASILAVAFCAIDFAGLIRIFTPEKGWDEPKEVWYLMGAWLLGATMNAVMTWWAVSLTLLDHQFGNEVLSRETLLTVVPIFVAVLVWLTRILFIGGLTMTGERLLDLHRSTRPARPRYQPTQFRNVDLSPDERVAAIIREGSGGRRHHQPTQQPIAIVEQPPEIEMEPIFQQPTLVVEEPKPKRTPNRRRPPVPQANNTPQQQPTTTRRVRNNNNRPNNNRPRTTGGIRRPNRVKAEARTLN